MVRVYEGIARPPLGSTPFPAMIVAIALWLSGISVMLGVEVGTWPDVLYWPTWVVTMLSSLWLSLAILRR